MILKVQVDDCKVYDTDRICRAISKTFGWDTPYTIDADDTVRFSICGVKFRGNVCGEEFRYSATNGGNGCLNWLQAVGGTHLLPAVLPDGDKVFLAI